MAMTGPKIQDHRKLSINEVGLHNAGLAARLLRIDQGLEVGKIGPQIQPKRHTGNNDGFVDDFELEQARPTDVRAYGQVVKTVEAAEAESQKPSAATRLGASLKKLGQTIRKYVRLTDAENLQRGNMSNNRDMRAWSVALNMVSGMLKVSCGIPGWAHVAGWAQVGFGGIEAVVGLTNLGSSKQTGMALIASGLKNIGFGLAAAFLPVLGSYINLAAAPKEFADVVITASDDTNAKD